MKPNAVRIALRPAARAPHQAPDAGGRVALAGADLRGGRDARVAAGAGNRSILDIYWVQFLNYDVHVTVGPYGTCVVPVPVL